jgi:hypothetical protein
VHSIAVASDKAYKLLVHGRWFSPGTPASSTIKTGRHDITEILLKVAVGTIKQTNKHIFGRPISDQPTQYIDIKTMYTLRAVVRGMKGYMTSTKMRYC